MQSETETIKSKTSIWNVPNVLTMFRVAIIPAVVILMYFDSPFNCFLVTCLFAIASITDFLDGYLARRNKLVSTFGKFLDPLADKLIVLAALIMLVYLDRISPFIVIVLLSREITVTGLRSIASSEGVIIAAGTLGKYKTAFQLVAILGLLLHYPYVIDFLIWKPMINFHMLGTITIIVSMVFSLISGFQYCYNFIIARSATE